MSCFLLMAFGSISCTFEVAETDAKPTEKLDFLGNLTFRSVGFRRQKELKGSH